MVANVSQRRQAAMEEREPFAVRFDLHSITDMTDEARAPIDQA